MEPPDYRELLRKTPNKRKLNVVLKQSPKGVGLFCTKKIQPNETIAYYQMIVQKISEYSGDGKYAFAVTTLAENISKVFLADMYEDSFPPPENNIPYWAPFSNEPSKHEQSNSDIDIDTNYNYTLQGRRRLKKGDIIRYRLYSTKVIEPGDEIMWYYGKRYHRDYEVNPN